MSRIRAVLPRATLACVIALAACEPFGWELGGALPDTSLLALNPEEPDIIAAAQAAVAPHVYLDLQDDGSGPVSVVFLIDHGKDGILTDDPAIRLTPEGGRCNPQVLRYYRFPPESTPRLVYSQNTALLERIPLADLPDLMAVEVTSEMMRRGMISAPDESRPQNVCSRKLWALLLATEDFGRTIFPSPPG